MGNNDLFAPSARTAQEVTALWDAYEQERNLPEKNELVMHYLSLVHRIVCRLLPLYGAHTQYDDLIGYGILGLIDAVEKFSPERNIRFETYATTRIRGEIIDNMRKQDWASSSLRNRITQIGETYEKLAREKHAQTVSEEDVAQAIGLSVKQVRDALEKAYMFNVVHFETLLNGANSTIENVLAGADKDTPDSMLEGQEFKQVLMQAIEDLSENERKVITLYYYEELMLKDISALLNVTPARVSQIHSRALLKIRIVIERYIKTGY